MARNVFRSVEVHRLNNTVYLEPVKSEIEEIEEIPDVEEYTGPTADDLRKEAEIFREAWDKEKLLMIENAKKEASAIIEEAKQSAFEEVKKGKNESQKIIQDALEQATATEKAALEKHELMLKEATEKVVTIEKDAYDAGYKDGLEKGFESGRGEVERLIEKVHQVLSAAIEKRNAIIEESETQLINLVLLISQKVIKVISENQKNVVINNVIQALRKLKTRGEVVVRVNLDDVKLTTEHIKDFMKMVDNVRSITVLEDSTVDKGGAIIETDFGEIDARVSSQLNEIKNKILELTPIKAKTEVVEDFI
ncbi:MAG: flagellar assembly protein FliH [Spirochaetes bacterium]|nr:flagellar assembly protein FliH [Spirochaetota bacterium]